MNIDDLIARAEQDYPRVLAELQELVTIPSVSNPAFDQSAVRVSAEAVAGLLRGAGMQDVRIAEATTPGGAVSRPAVLGHKVGVPGAPTVLLYAHHDVQPPGDAAAWSTEDPFVPEVRGDRLYGRGAADDKAGIMAHVGALRILGDDLPVNVTVFVEGEEEIGSPTFRDFLEQHRDALAADVIAVADSSNWAIGTPALTTSLRGVVQVEVEVRVAHHAVHSGLFGGPSLDAVTSLARLIATLHDDDGNVAVTGLQTSDAELVDYPEADFRASSGMLDEVRLAGSGPLAGRLWNMPAIAVIGLDATPVATSSNTLIPAARAAISLRVAPGQAPAEAARALTDHLQSHATLGAQVTTTVVEAGPGFDGAGDGPALQAAEWALARAWGTRPVHQGMGGSIPFIADLKEVFPQAQILVTGVEDPQSRAHSEDESLHVGEHARAVLAEALLLARLGGVV
ncbi:dipeptidase [Georgenia sp. Z1491]|uniref:dipeptidase n=1 Tax=Georgenia sp. Z1491 TaxID=3416707 RepID=UPI003CF43A81